MNIYTKEGLLILVQLDHLSGELIGPTVDRFYQAGAHNVQYLNAITKKNRPSYILLIDTHPQYQAAIEAIIVDELGSTGWHVMHTDHRHYRTEILSTNIEIKIEQQIFEVEIAGKTTKAPFDLIRPELKSCEYVQHIILNRTQIMIPLRYIEYHLSIALNQKLKRIDFDDLNIH